MGLQDAILLRIRSAAPPSPSGGDVEGQTQPITRGLQRKLKARHVQMIAIGSNIGTGLFVGSGKALHTGGPLALVVGFILIAVALSIMMQCLGEIAVVLPVSGSFTRYATRLFDPALGFAIGWQYWLAWVAVFGAEASAFVILINYWSSDSRFTPLWISIFILITVVIHVCPVRVFGEVEFVVSTIKVVAVVLFVVVTCAIIGGAGAEGYVHRGQFWKLPGLNAGLNNGFKGFGSVFVLAAFAVGGVEAVGVVAGEAAMPRYTLPRAIRTLMWRIAIFYILSMALLSLVVPYDSAGLVGSGDANSSPFVIAVKRAGIRVLPDLLNAVLIISVCSVGSSSIYISSRTLQAMSEDGFAWKFFGKTDSHGRPYYALLATGAAGTTLAYLNVSSTGSIVFGWFSSISGLAFFLAWLVIIACNWRFHAALKAQNDHILHESLAFRATLWPWLSIFAFAAFTFMIVCQLVVAISPIDSKPSASGFFSQFLSVPIFLVMWAGYKIIYRTQIHTLETIDLQTGRRTEDPEEREKLVEYAGWSRGQRLLSYLRF